MRLLNRGNGHGDREVDAIAPAFVRVAAAVDIDQNALRLELDGCDLDRVAGVGGRKVFHQR